MNYDRERNNDDQTDNNVEDEILNNVEDITGESFDDDEDPQTDDDDPTEDDEPETDDSDKQTADKTAQPRDRFAEQRAKHEEVARRIPARRGVDYDYNSENGDVINPQTGEVIFKNGTVERAMFAELRDTQFKHSQLERAARNMQIEGKRLESIVAGYKRAPDVADNLKLNAEEQVRAFTMMAEYKKNPVQAFRKMLNEFQVDGGDLSDIFDNLEKIQADGIEARLGKRIDELTGPQRERQQQETQHQELVTRLNNDIETFFGNNPEAEQHAELITHLINKGDATTLDQAWTKILRFASHNGLDPRQDFRAQLEARQRAAQPPKPQHRPMPSGRMNGNSVRPSRDAKPAYEMRNKDIVADAMREAGFDV